MTDDLRALWAKQRAADASRRYRARIRGGAAKALKQLTFVDPELGPMRHCQRCNDDWPDDDQFWAQDDGVARCRVCVSDASRRYRDRIRGHKPRAYVQEHGGFNWARGPITTPDGV